VENWKKTCRHPYDLREPRSFRFFTFEAVNTSEHGIEPTPARTAAYIFVIAVLSFITAVCWALWGFIDMFVLLAHGCFSEMWLVFMVWVFLRLMWFVYFVLRISGHVMPIALDTDASAFARAKEGRRESYGAV